MDTPPLTWSSTETSLSNSASENSHHTFESTSSDIPHSESGWDWCGRGSSHVDFEKNESLPLLQGKFLGYGVHGGVYETQVNGKAVAWKRKYCRTKITAQAQREIGIIKRLDHRHIIKLIGTYTHGPFLGLLLWPVTICDLATFLTDVDGLMNGKDLDDDTTIERLIALGIGGAGSVENARIAAVRRLKQSLGCITGAIVYLHEHHIKHKDLKPSNVLLGPEDLYITDFGTSSYFENTVSLSQDGDRGTPKYFSPEVANFQPSGRAADIFSLGCIFFEIVSLCNRRSLEAQKALRPDHDNSFHANLAHLNRVFDFDEVAIESNTDQHLFSKIRLMLKEDPQERPAAGDIEYYLRIIDAFSDDPGTMPLWGLCCCPTPTPLTSLPPSVGSLELTVGNSHEGLGQQNTWEFFIRSSHDELIDKVLIILHPSFSQPLTIRNSSPFIVRGQGWGYFTLGALVVLKREYFWNSNMAKTAPGGQEHGMLPLHWTLNFEQPYTDMSASFEIGQFSAAPVAVIGDEEEEL